MAQEERYNDRELVYSAWHRIDSTSRFISVEESARLAMIDLDGCIYIEYNDGDMEPLALIEIARDTGQSYKAATVTRKLAKRAGLYCLVVLYTLSNKKNPANSLHFDIERFKVKRLYPEPTGDWRVLTPREYAHVLLKVRRWMLEKIHRDQGTIR